MAIRDALGLSQRDFGNKINYSSGHLSYIEQGKKPVTDKLKRLLCMHYGVNPNYLERGEEPMFLSRGEMHAQAATDPDHPSHGVQHAVGRANSIAGDDQVGARLREIQQNWLLDDARLAGRLGLTAEELRRAMVGQAPLPPSAFDLAYFHMGVNPAWLRFGEGPRQLRAGEEIRAPDCTPMENRADESDVLRVQLPRHDPRPVTDSELILLQKAINVMRSPGYPGSPDLALAQNIEAFFGSIEAQRSARPPAREAERREQVARKTGTNS